MRIYLHMKLQSYLKIAKLPFKEFTLIPSDGTYRKHKDCKAGRMSWLRWEWELVIYKRKEKITNTDQHEEER